MTVKSTTGSKLFGRRVTLQCDTSLFDGLRIAFSVKRTLTKEPNPAKIQIYNLSQESRTKFQAQDAAVILSAGYQESFAQIWSGSLRTVSHVRQGPDWVTKVDGGDGEHLLRTGRYSRSYKAGTPIATVITDVATATGLGLGNLQQQLAAANFPGGLTQYAKGISVQGLAATTLQDLLQSAGFTYSIQDGKIQVLAPGQSLTGGQIFSLSSSSGLLGSPEVCEEGKKTKKKVLKAKMLLNPLIVPGCNVNLDSLNVKGNYRVEKVEHKGDTHGADFMTEIECKLS